MGPHNGERHPTDCQSLLFVVSHILQEDSVHTQMLSDGFPVAFFVSVYEKLKRSA